MAIKTQLRLNQLTASFGGLLGPVLGDINDGGVNPGVENKAALADIAVVDLSGSLSYLATAIRRVHGGADFSDQTAGEFSHVTSTFTGKILVGGDTAIGDDAALGYTAAEGLILAGQGSTNDVTIKNDADATVLSIATGTTTVTAAGNVDVDGGTLSVKAGNDANAGLRLRADNSDDAGDDWQVQGNMDQTFQVGNDIASAGTFVSHLTITPNGTVANSVTDVKGILRLSNGSVQNSSQGEGILLGGNVDDVTVQLGKGTGVTSTVGDLKVGGNDIQNSQGETTISMDVDQNVSIAADLDVLGGDLVVTAANDAAASLTLKADNSDDNGDDWIVAGNANQSFALANNISGSPVAHFTVTPHATVAQSTVATAGNLKVGSNIIQASDGGSTITMDDSDNVTIGNNLKVGGNVIQASDGGNTITMNTSDLVTFAGDLDHANTAWTIGGSITTPATKITLGGGAAVEILGDLFVKGTEHIIDTDNLRIKDPLIAFGAGAITVNANGGMALISGSSGPAASFAGGQADMVFGRVGVNTWGAGIMDTQSGSVTSVAGMGMANMRVRNLELSGSANYLSFQTDVEVVAAADIILDAGGGNIKPRANDDSALGVAGVAFSDLFLAEGGVINWDNGDLTLTQANNVLTLGSGKLVSDVDVSAKALTTSAAQNLAIVQGVGANTDIGAFDLRAATLTADGLTATRVVFAGTDGVLSSDADMVFATDTLTVTKLGAYEQAGAVNFSDEAMTNVNIDSGAIDGTNVTVGAGKTLTVSAGTLATSAAQNLAIVQGAAANIDIGAYTLTGTQLISDIADGTTPLVVTSTTVVANLNASTVAGQTMAIPGNIGGTTPSTATFTTITANTSILPDANDGAPLGAAGTGFSDLFLAEGAVINWDSGDFTLTQAGNLLTVAGGELRMDGAQKVEFGGNSNWIQLDTNLKIVAAADILMDAAGNDVLLQSVGTNPFLDFNRAGAGESYLNFSTNDGAGLTNGSGGFGFRNNAGTMQFKSSGGSWAGFGASAAASKTSTVLTGSIPAGARLGIDGGFDMSGIAGTSQTNMVDVYVNGQMMLSGGTIASITNDYAVDVMLSNGAASDLHFNFALDEADVVTVTVR